MKNFTLSQLGTIIFFPGKKSERALKLISKSYQGETQDSHEACYFGHDGQILRSLSPTDLLAPYGLTFLHSMNTELKFSLFIG